MKTENKKYKLKRWYPSLYEDIEEGIEVEYKDGWIYYVNTRGNKTCVGFDEYEFNFTDFWEEVEQPLFVTDDNIKIFDDTIEIISVSIKHHTVSKWGYRYLSKPLDRENFKYFGIEANADKYIEDHKPKPLFITDDGVELFDEADKLFIVNKKCYKKESEISNIYDKTNRKDFKYFFHESNADEYIWRNMRVFSYNDIEKYQSGGEGVFYDIKAIAKKRSKQ